MTPSRVSFIRVCICLLVSSLEVRAQDSAVVGIGSWSCGKYLDARSAKSGESQLRQGLFGSWAQGYLSGMNAYRALKKQRMLTLPDYQSIDAYLDKYCRDNPLNMVSIGALMLFIELEAK
jgi:hypothetical protein